MELKEKLKNIIEENYKLYNNVVRVTFDKKCIKFYPELYKEIKEFQNLYFEDITNFAELCYIILNGKSKCINENCDNDVEFNMFKYGYKKYCSVLCQHSDENLKNKIVNETKKGVLKKYGVDNISKLDSIKKKKEKTSLKNYGVKYNSQRKVMRKKNSEMMRSSEQIQKIKDGITKIYGTYTAANDLDVRNKTLNTFNEKRKERLKEYLIPLKYEFIKYTDKFNIDFKCDKNHEFNINYQLFHLRLNRQECICTECNPIHNSFSKPEIEILDFIKSICEYKLITNSRNLLENNMELDIYIPELQLAFEFNGVYWHNEVRKPNNYHQYKSKLAKDKEIKLIHIYQDDWNYKHELVKSRISNLLGFSNKIYARKCKIKEVNYIDSKEFLKLNHIQGYITSSYNYGLYYNNELVSLMTFGKRELYHNDNTIELLRFCNKLNTTVIGGSSKLFKYFLNIIGKVRIVSYCDISWNNIENKTVYSKLGFKYISQTNPNYWWVINGIKSNRLNWSKSNLIKKELLLEGETETQCMHRLGYYRIYDSGSFKYEYLHKTN